MQLTFVAFFCLIMLGIGLRALAAHIPKFARQTNSARNAAQLLHNAQYELHLCILEIKRLGAELDRSNSELSSLTKEQKKIQGKLGQFPIGGPLPVVESFAEPNAKLAFEASVSNNTILRARTMQAATSFNPFWEIPRYVLIWAESLDDATHELNDTYPATAGWVAEMQGEVRF